MKKPDHARFADWDAAYVLGALSPADRRAYEDHLEDCTRCGPAVSELSALPGLLGRIDGARAFALLEQAPGEDEAAADPGLVSSIRSLDRTRRVRRALYMTGGLAAAAALASALTVAVPAALNQPAQPDVTVSLRSPAAQSAPLDVTVRMTTVGWGTKLDMDCRYPATTSADGGYGPAAYSLWVVGDDGTETSVSTWNASPGTDVRLDAGTAEAIDDIAEVQLRTGDGSRVLMLGEPS